MLRSWNFPKKTLEIADYIVIVFSEMITSALLHLCNLKFAATHKSLDAKEPLYDFMGLAQAWGAPKKTFG